MSSKYQSVEKADAILFSLEKGAQQLSDHLDTMLAGKGNGRGVHTGGIDWIIEVADMCKGILRLRDKVATITGRAASLLGQGEPTPSVQTVTYHPPLPKTFGRVASITGQSHPLRFTGEQMGDRPSIGNRMPDFILKVLSSGEPMNSRNIAKGVWEAGYRGGLRSKTLISSQSALAVLNNNKLVERVEKGVYRISPTGKAQYEALVTAGKM